MNDEFDVQVKKIRQILISRGLENKSIYYSEFLEIYESYKSVMSEKDFAVLVLGVKTGNFNESKKGKHRIKILKNEQEELLKKYGARTQRELEIQEGVSRKIRPGSSITYKEFLDLYELYKDDLDMKEFSRILGLSSSNLNTMKSRGNRGKILRFLKKEITQERKDEILRELQLPVKSIEYSDFLKLYMPYSNEIDEQEFAIILNISYNSYIKLKNGKERATIGSNQENRVKYEFHSPKYYSVAQLEIVAKKYEITINEILEILYSKNDYYIEQIKRVLQDKKKIFIGDKKINNNFIEKYKEELFKIAHEYSKALGINLHTSVCSEDIAQDALIVTLQTKGDVVENLAEEIAIESLIRNIKVRIKFKHMDYLKKKKEISLDQNISSSDNRSRWNDKTSSSNIKIEDFEENIDDDATPVSVIQECIYSGMNRTESLKFVMKKFGLKKEELLEILQKELFKNKSIRVDKDGKRYLVEREK